MVYFASKNVNYCVASVVFFLEYAGELHIIALRRGKGQNSQVTHTTTHPRHATTPAPGGFTVSAMYMSICSFNAHLGLGLSFGSLVLFPTTGCETASVV